MKINLKSFKINLFLKKLTITKSIVTFFQPHNSLFKKITLFKQKWTTIFLKHKGYKIRSDPVRHCYFEQLIIYFRILIINMLGCQTF